MIYGHYRASTKGKALTNGLDVQKQEILAKYANAIIKGVYRS